MEFKKIFRGYDPKEVDKYIADTAERESVTRRAQRERIEELSEENYNLRERIVELQRRQNDVAEAMIVAQKVAAEMEQNAKDNADRVLFEAKKFYATWQAYSKTIVASFTDDELAAFNALGRKIGDVIASYELRLLEGDRSSDTADGQSNAATEDNADNTATVANKSATENDSVAAKKSTPKPKRKSAEDFVKLMEQTADELNAKSKKAEEKAKAKKQKPANPIERVENAAGQSVDLKELLRPEQSLEELCADLGLIDSEDV